MNYRLRATSGEHAGLWLWMMDVTKGGLPIQVMNWPGVEQQFSLHTFHPKFIAEEGSAWRGVSLEAAERFQRILKRLGIETEIL